MVEFFADPFSNLGSVFSSLLSFARFSSKSRVLSVELRLSESERELELSEVADDAELPEPGLPLESGLSRQSALLNMDAVTLLRGEFRLTLGGGSILGRALLSLGPWCL